MSLTIAYSVVLKYGIMYSQLFSNYGVGRGKWF